MLRPRCAHHAEAAGRSAQSRALVSWLRARTRGSFCSLSPDGCRVCRAEPGGALKGLMVQQGQSFFLLLTGPFEAKKRLLKRPLQSLALSPA